MTSADAPRHSQRGLPFVGRWSELSTLSLLADEARAGEPRIALIVGDAGVGKSTLARELVAELDDVRVAAGRCRETMRLAYSPFRDSLFPMLADHLATHPGESRYRDLVDQLTDSITSPVGDVSELEAKTHQRLVDAAVVAVELAREHMLLLVIDDLHWADESTLALVEAFTSHVADASLSGAVPVLVVATLRPPGDDTHRVALERLSREPIATELHLEGLPRLDLAAFAQAVAGRALTDRELTELLDATRGNPLYAEAVLRHGSGQRLPVHIRDAIAVPIEKLSPGVRSTLEAAAFFDDLFSAADVAAVVDSSSVNVIRHLDEAHLARVVEQVGDGWQFSHPLYRRLFLEAASPSTAQRMHAAIARLLRERDEEADVRALAQHLALAGDLVAAGDVVGTVMRAGRLEFGACNWSRACDHFLVVTQAVSVGEAPEIDAAELHHLMGLAFVFQGEVDAGIEHYSQAEELYRQRGDGPRRLAVMASLRQAELSVGALGVSVDERGLRRAIDEVRLERPGAAAAALGTLAELRWAAGQLDEAEAAARETIELASTIGDADSETLGWLVLSTVGWTRFEPASSAAHLEQAHEIAPDAAHPGRRVGALNRLPITRLWLGDVEGSVEVAEEAIEMGEALRYRRELGLPLTALAMVETLRGDLGRARHLIDRALTIDRMTSYSWASVFARPLLAVVCDLNNQPGDATGAIDELEQTMGAGSNWTRAARLLHLASTARRGEPVDLAAAPIGLDPDAQPSIGVAGLAAAHVALADSVGEPALVEHAAGLLEAAEQRGLVYIASLGILVERALGRALTLAGDFDGIGRIEAALERASADGAALEISRASRDLAGAFQARAAHGDADRANALMHDHMRLCRALELDGLVASTPTPLAPVPGRSSDPRRAVVMIVDVCDSTRLAQQLGDVDYAHELQSILGRVYDAVAHHGGRIVNHTGDGALIAFDDADEAIDCASACHARVSSAKARLHFGVHAGDVVELDGNLFGAAVNTAARLCDEAGPRETVVSSVVRDLAAPAGRHVFVDRGQPVLKGLSNSVQVYAVLAT